MQDFVEQARLRRFLDAHTERFALALVRVSGPTGRDQVVEAVMEFAEGRDFRHVDARTLEPLQVWEQLAQQGSPGSILLLSGVDQAFHAPDGELLSLLNRQREQIAKLCPGPLLLLAVDSALVRFHAQAPDLADWYAATFDFSAPGDLDEGSSEVRSSSSSGLPYLEMEARISLLASQVEGALSPLERSRLLNDWATLLQERGRYAEAEPLFVEALEIDEQVSGREHPNTLASVNNLALLNELQGRYAEAEPLYERALHYSEKVLGREHPRTLTSVNNLANLYVKQGRYGKAEPLYERALRDREKVLGREHPDTLTTVNTLANLYAKQARYGEAEPLLERALLDRQKVQGREHPDTQTSVNNLAMLYVRQGRYGEAEPLLERALRDREKVLGREHPSTLISVNNLARLYSSQGRYGQAEPLYARALRGAEKVLGPDHPDTKIYRANLASLHEKR